MTSIKELLAQGEHLHQDFKFRIDDQRKIARTLCAFANTEGGRLLIGVKDNKKIAGCNPEEELFMIEGAAKKFCQPEVYFTSKIWQEEFRLVLEVNVPISKVGPHKAKDDEGRWKSYIRIKDHTTSVNKILERVWIEKKRPSTIPEKPDEEELKLLKLVQNEQPVKLSKLYRKSNLPLWQVDKLIVLLICHDLVEMLFEQDGVYYRSK